MVGAISVAVTITFRNAITDAREEIEAAPELTVRQVVERSGFIAPGIKFDVRDRNGENVSDRPAADFANTVLSVGLPADRIVGGGPSVLVEEIAAGFLALKLLGPFAEAFASKLGERLGESTAAAVSKIRLFRGVRPPLEKFEALQATTDTLIVIPEVLSDDARLALIDIDLTQDEIRGKILRWDSESKTWNPNGGRFQSRLVDATNFGGRPEPDVSNQPSNNRPRRRHTPVDVSGTIHRIL
jgi:hypothetical protein